jgi:hypothetical protein
MWATTSAGTGIDVTVTGGPPIGVDLTNPDFDLVYYEREETGSPGQLALNRVTVEVSQSLAGPWHVVFNWGDRTPDLNTNIGQAGYGSIIFPTEPDNSLIPMIAPPLFQPSVGPVSGIAIDVDAPLLLAGAPSGSYPYVRISGAPMAETDSIEVLP